MAARQGQELRLRAAPERGQDQSSSHLRLLPTRVKLGTRLAPRAIAVRAPATRPGAAAPASPPPLVLPSDSTRVGRQVSPPGGPSPPPPSARQSAPPARPHHGSSQLWPPSSSGWGHRPRPHSVAGAPLA